MTIIIEIDNSKSEYKALRDGPDKIKLYLVPTHNVQLSMITLMFMYTYIVEG